ncbi:MAG: hypothetical protein IT439_05870 [Phycisphaerales bacterium]|nr:hypothetical protein [Phycisphaerales bacterium]
MRILWGSCLVLGLVLSGCGKKDDSGKTGDTGKTAKTGGTTDKGGGGGGGGGGATAEAIVGTWTMDAEALKKIMFEEMKKQPGMPADLTMDNPMIQAGLAMADQLKMTVEVKADGTWSSSGTGPEGENTSSSGTWKKAGANYEMIRNKDDGKDVEPSAATGTIKNGKLELQIPEVPFAFILKRA